MNLIVAVDERFGIAKDNQLLANIPSDLAHFKSHTTGKTVIMGRKTILTLKDEKPLPNRRTIVFSRDRNYRLPEAIVVHSVEELMEMIKELGISRREIYVCGGREIYELLIPFCETAYITLMYHDLRADTFISEITENTGWELVNESNMNYENGIYFKYLTYRRNL